MSKKLPKSIRRFIRHEKARIRREILDLKEQERLIKLLYERIKPVKTYRIIPGKSAKTQKAAEPKKANKSKKENKKINKPQKAKKDKQNK